MDKKNIIEYIGKLAQKQDEAMDGEFVAPCLRRGRIAVRIAGIVCRYKPSDPSFEGWGRFKVGSSNTVAELTGEATRRQISSYLSTLPRCRFRLVFQGLDQSWAAIPRNKGVFERHFGTYAPSVIRLVSTGTRFDSVVARHDGATWWYEGPDRTDSAKVRVSMAEAYDSGKMPEVAGASPEDRDAFALAVEPKPVVGIYSPPTDEEKIRKMLERGGGAKLLSFTDVGDHWNISWVTKDGRRSSSSVMKDRGMSIISAGMCLSGRDADFDLISLVSVVENRDDGM